MTTKYSKQIEPKKKILYGLVIGAGLALIFILYLSLNNIKTNSITSFEECAAAGNPIMESYPRQCASGGKTFVESINNSSELQFVEIGQGQNVSIGYNEPRNYIINSLDEWNSIFGNANINPDINFDEKVVIAIIMGQRPTGGYSVSVKKIEASIDNIEVFVEERSPGSMCMVTMAFTNPYQIVAIDKIDKEIKFTVETSSYDCL